METGKNKATNNYILRMWSWKHYNNNQRNTDNMYSGTVQNVRTKKLFHFNTPAEFMTIIEKNFRGDEKVR